MATAGSDPIIALATPPVAASRAVLRLSGARLLEDLQELLPASIATFPRERGACVTAVEWASGSVVQADVLIFPGPHSATGEDVLEFHLPGSLPVVEQCIAAWEEQGVRRAEAGEFTRRAFLNGRLDLTQAEAVLGLVSAGSEAEARAAASLLTGGLSSCMQRTRDALHAALTDLEAGLDFEEGDSQDLAPEEVDAWLDAARLALEDGVDVDRRSRVESRGILRIGLLGPPNAGKTALVRSLTGEDALVSDIEGTTRDWRATPWHTDLVELPCELVDGPGLGGQASDHRDAAAREQARAASPEVDLWWACQDPSSAAEVPELPREAPSIQVWTKADLGAPIPPQGSGRPAVSVSATEGTGLEELCAMTREQLLRSEADRAAVLAGSERHQAVLQQALHHVQAAQELASAGGLHDLMAEEVRLGLQALAALVGAWTPEDLLDRLFARFCVGK